MAEVNGGSPVPATQATNASTNPQMRTPPPSQNAASVSTADPPFPTISFNDSGLERRPRDARIVHMMLADMGVTAYQERVPQMLIDFAYRHTSSILQDALHFSTEVYNTTGIASKSGQEAITLNALRLAVSSRTFYQFNPGMAKEQLQEGAAEKNKIALPPIPTDGPLRLPNDKFTFSGVGYGLREEWESEGEEEIDTGNTGLRDQIMADREEEEEEEEGDRMEDIFGESAGGGNDGDEMEE